MNKQNLFSRSNICLDLDGTVYKDNVVFPGLIKALNILSQRGIKIFYITNNTSRSTSDYYCKLKSLNLPVTKNSLVTPIIVYNHIFKNNNNLKTYVLGSKCVAREVLTNEFVINKSDQILVTFDKTLTYKSLKNVCEYINSGMKYYAIIWIQLPNP